MEKLYTVRKKQDMELILAPYCKIQALIEDSRGNH